MVIIRCIWSTVFGLTVWHFHSQGPHTIHGFETPNHIFYDILSHNSKLCYYTCM
jgi:hypothetical protein